MSNFILQFLDSKHGDNHLKKITLFVIIIWAAIGISVAAISIPTLSSEVGKAPAIPQDTVKTTSPENPADEAASNNKTNQDPKKNNNSDHSHSGLLKKQNSFKSLVNQEKNNIETKRSSKNN